MSETLQWDHVDLSRIWCLISVMQVIVCVNVVSLSTGCIRQRISVNGLLLNLDAPDIDNRMYCFVQWM